MSTRTSKMDPEQAESRLSVVIRNLVRHACPPLPDPREPLVFKPATPASFPIVMRADSAVLLDHINTLTAERDSLKQKVEELERQSAEMRTALIMIEELRNEDQIRARDISKLIEVALNSDAGKGWVPRAALENLRERAAKAVETYEDDSPRFVTMLDRVKTAAAVRALPLEEL